MKFSKKTFTCSAIILISLCVNFVEVSAQYRRSSYNFSDGLSVAVMFGPTVFAGDLGLTYPDPSPDQKELNYVGISYGIAFEKAIKEIVSVKFQANKGTLQGERKNVNEPPYISFNNDFYEFTLSGNVDWTNVISGYYQFRKVNVYSITGVSLLTFKEESRWGEGITDQSLVGELDYTHLAPGDKHGNAVAFIAKAGAGVKIRIDNDWSIVTEFTGNFAMSDRLDGYVYRAGGIDKTDSNDFYYMGQIGLAYSFGGSGFRSQPKFNRRSYAHRYKKNRYKGSSRRRR